MIFGVDDREPNRRAFPLSLMLQPFSIGTWFSLSASLVAVAATALLTARAFGPRPFSRRSFATFVVHIYSDYTVAAWAPPSSPSDSSR